MWKEASTACGTRECRVFHIRQSIHGVFIGGTLPQTLEDGYNKDGGNSVRICSSLEASFVP
jgi:hypothetical protein